jgi:putative transposase
LAHRTTVLAQILQFVPRHEFEALAKRHHTGRSFRVASRWSQFTALVAAQLSGRSSLRDLVANLRAQSQKLYHLGARVLSRSNLARINDEKPHVLYEELFARLLGRCERVAPKHKFRFKNRLYSLDSSVIDLCLSVFPWARFRTTKGAIKLHVGLDLNGYLPSFVAVTDGKTSDLGPARSLRLQAGSIVACDRGYLDYRWFADLTNQGVFFVTRLKRGARYTVTQRRKVLKEKGLTSDQTIEWATETAQKDCPIPLRRVGYRDAETGIEYFFLTNNFHLAAHTIAEIYKQRWQVELFFKWIKQHLKIKSFLGTSRNAVLTQIWIALCVYLLLAFIRYKHRLSGGLRQILLLLQLNLFERRELLPLLLGETVKPPDTDQGQLCFS